MSVRNKTIGWFAVMVLLFGIGLYGRLMGSTEWTRNYDWTTDRDAAVPITAARMDAEFDDIATKLNQKVVVKSTAPSSPIDGQTWVDTGANPPELEIYDSTNSVWEVAGISRMDDYVKNTATNDSKGLHELWLYRSDAQQITCSPGSIAIGNYIYSTATAIAVSTTDAVAWAASGTSGVATGVTYTDGADYYVFATTRTDDTDSFLILINDDTTPTQVTVGTDARVIGRFVYETDGVIDIGPQILQNYKPFGIAGWDFALGDGSGGMDDTVAFGVTFRAAPIVVLQSCGNVATTSVPTSPGTFDANGQFISSPYAITTTQMTVYTHGTAAGDSSSSINYGYTYVVFGDWTI